MIEASKTDGAAEGVTRTLACTCPAFDCPVKAATFLKQGRKPYQNMVRTRTGQAVSKETMVDAIKGYAELLGQADVSRATGHSMHVTGAQRLLRVARTEGPHNIRSVCVRHVDVGCAACHNCTSYVFCYDINILPLRPTICGQCVAGPLRFLRRAAYQIRPCF